MDVVEFLREDPFVFCVVDLEGKIGGTAESRLVGGGGKWEGRDKQIWLSWLDNGEICSYYTS